MKRSSVKKGKVSSSRSCDDKLADAVGTDVLAVVGGSQPATPSTPGEGSHFANTPPAPVVDAFTPDGDGYATIDIPPVGTVSDRGKPVGSCCRRVCDL